MTAFQYAVPGGCLALLLTTTGAFAQVTAQQVWDDWKSSMNMYGSDSVTIGSEAYANGVLTVTDLGFAISQDGTDVTGNLPQLVLTEQADGTVAVTMSDVYPISIVSTDEWDGVTEADLTLTNSGMSMVVSGAPGNLNYAVSVDRYELAVAEIVSDGEVLPLDAVIGMDDVTGNYTVSGPAELRNIAYDLSVGMVDIKSSVAEPGTANSATLNGTIAGISGSTTMTMPANIDEIEPEALFASGFAMDGDQTLGATQMSFTFSENGETTQGSMSLSGGTIAAAISNSALDYSFSLMDLNVQASSPSEMPFPITFAASELGFGLAMPMEPTDAPADFSARLSLANVTVNEEIWAMLDPSAIIPRDPATVTVDLSGSATLTVALMSPEAQNMMEPPGLLHALNINDVTLAFGGASATASGAFTFDNNDMSTFPGMPRPTGKLDIALNGVNGLMEKLVQIGMLPAEQMMPVSMMMGMFAVPVGDDMLTSTIEFTADGQLLANGQRLQ